MYLYVSEIFSSDTICAVSAAYLNTFDRPRGVFVLINDETLEKTVKIHIHAMRDYFLRPVLICIKI